MSGFHVRSVVGVGVGAGVAVGVGVGGGDGVNVSVDSGSVQAKVSVGSKVFELVNSLDAVNGRVGSNVSDSVTTSVVGGADFGDERVGVGHGHRERVGDRLGVGLRD